jgi:hypothetical protein
MTNNEAVSSPSHRLTFSDREGGDVETRGQDNAYDDDDDDDPGCMLLIIMGLEQTFCGMCFMDTEREELPKMIDHLYDQCNVSGNLCTVKLLQELPKRQIRIRCIVIRTNNLMLQLMKLVKSLAPCFICSGNKYNKSIGYGDQTDWIIDLYRRKVRSRKWYHFILFNFLDMAVSNAWLF